MTPRTFGDQSRLSIRLSHLGKECRRHSIISARCALHILFCCLLLHLAASCDRDNPAKPTEPRWTALGFEDKLPLRMRSFGNFIYVCAGPHGLWRRDLSDSHSDWVFLGLADSTFDDWHYGVLDVDVRDEDILVAYTSKYIERDPGIWRSTDGGSSWARSDSGVSAPEYPFSYMFSVARSPDNDSLGVAANGATFTTADRGATWTLRSPARDFRSNCLSLAWNPHRDGEVWLFGQNAFWRPVLSRSRDEGVNWEDLGFVNASPVPHESAVYGLAFDPFESRTLYVALHGILAKSTDAGENWTVPLFHDEHGRPLSAIACNTCIEGVIYVAVGDSLYWSRDGGSSMQPMATPNEAAIASMVFHKSTKALVIGTVSGIFQMLAGER
jgi:photosystem II stability/assembly factor-like uncharacterized protein